mgnify:FL=1
MKEDDATPDSIMTLDILRSRVAVLSIAPPPSAHPPSAIRPPPIAVQPHKGLMARLLGYTWPFGLNSSDSALTRDRKKFRRRSYHSGGGAVPRDQVDDGTMAQQLSTGRPRPSLRRSSSAPSSLFPLRRGRLSPAAVPGATAASAVSPAVAMPSPVGTTSSPVSTDMLQMLTKMQQSREAGQDRRRRTRAQTDSNVLQHWPREEEAPVVAPCGVRARRRSGPSGELDIGALEAEGRDSDSGND